MITVISAKRLLLMQEIQNKLEANHITLQTGRDVALEKLTIPKLKHLMDSLDNYLTRMGK